MATELEPLVQLAAPQLLQLFSFQALTSRGPANLVGRTRRWLKVMSDSSHDSAVDVSRRGFFCKDFTPSESKTSLHDSDARRVCSL